METPNPINKFEESIERIIYNSRWLLVPVFLSLVIALAGFSFHFMAVVFNFTIDLFSYQKNELLLILLTLVDKVLVAGLIVMVLIGGYENFVGKLNVSPSKNRLKTQIR